MVAGSFGRAGFGRWVLGGGSAPAGDPVTISADSMAVVSGAGVGDDAPVVYTSRTILDVITFPRAALVPIARIRLGGLYGGFVEGDHRKVLQYVDAGAVTVRAHEAETTNRVQPGSLSPSSARVQVAEPVSLTDTLPAGPMPLIVELSYLDNGSVLPYERVFTGEWNALGRRHFPRLETIVGTGLLGATSATASKPTRITHTREYRMIVNLLEHAGAKGYDIYGLEDKLGSDAHVITSPEGTPVAGLIAQADATWLYLTRDCRDGMIRRGRMPYVGHGFYQVRRKYGDRVNNGRQPIRMDSASLDVDRSKRVTRVKVLGWVPPDGRTERGTHTRHYETGWVPSPPHFVTQVVQTDLVENDGLAQRATEAWMRWKNKLVQTLTFEVDGDPYVEPLWVVDFSHDGLGIDGRAFLALEVTQRYTGGDWSTRITAENLIGDGSGVVVDTHPIAAFDHSWHGPDENGFYWAICTNRSTDPDGDETLEEANWSNDQNGYVQSGAGDAGTTYLVAFDQSAWDAHPKVTLQAVDPDQLWSLKTHEVRT